MKYRTASDLKFEAVFLFLRKKYFMKKILFFLLALIACNEKENNNRTFQTMLLVNCDSTLRTTYIFFLRDSSYSCRLDSSSGKFSYYNNSIILHKPTGSFDTFTRVNKCSSSIPDTFKIIKNGSPIFYFIDFVD